MTAVLDTSSLYSGQEPEFHLMNKITQVSSLKVSAPGEGVALLKTIAREPGLWCAGIRQRLCLPASLIHGLISGICELGLIRRISLGGCGLGLRLLKVAGIANESDDLQPDAAPLLHERAERVEPTCHFGGFEQGGAVYPACAERARDIVVKSHVGQRVPVYCSALGKSLIASSAPEQLDIVMADLAFEMPMPKTAQIAAGVRLLRADVRYRGLAFDDEEQASQHRSAIATASWSPQSTRS